MDDEGGDWFSAADEPAEAESQPSGEAAGGGAAASGEGAPEGQAAQDDRPEADVEYLDPDKLILFKHWIRPKFLQYKYLYDYRHNYYDDVIDFLEKRNRGVRREIPRAQTWAERALRTYTSNINRNESFRRTLEDTKLVEKTRLSGAFFRYHSKEYINRRYSTLLY